MGGWSALHKASVKGHVEAASTLIKHGAEIDQKTKVIPLLVCARSELALLAHSYLAPVSKHM